MNLDNNSFFEHGNKTTHEIVVYNDPARMQKVISIGVDDRFDVEAFKIAFGKMDFKNFIKRPADIKEFTLEQLLDEAIERTKSGVVAK